MTETTPIVETPVPETTEKKDAGTLLLPDSIPAEIPAEIAAVLEVSELKERLADISIKIMQGRQLTTEDQEILPTILAACETYDLANASRKCKHCWGKGFYISNDPMGIRTDVTCTCVTKYYVKKGDAQKIYLSSKERSFYDRILTRFKNEQILSEVIEQAEGVEHSAYRVVYEEIDETEISFQIKTTDPLEEDAKYIDRPIKNKQGDVIGHTIGLQKVDEHTGIMSAIVKTNFLKSTQNES